MQAERADERIEQLASASRHLCPFGIGIDGVGVVDHHEEPRQVLFEQSLADEGDLGLREQPVGTGDEDHRVGLGKVVQGGALAGQAGGVEARGVHQGHAMAQQRHIGEPHVGQLRGIGVVSGGSHGEAALQILERHHHLVTAGAREHRHVGSLRGGAMDHRDRRGALEGGGGQDLAATEGVDQGGLAGLELPEHRDGELLGAELASGSGAALAELFFSPLGGDVGQLGEGGLESVLFGAYGSEAVWGTGGLGWGGWCRGWRWLEAAGDHVLAPEDLADVPEGQGVGIAEAGEGLLLIDRSAMGRLVAGLADAVSSVELRPGEETSFSEPAHSGAKIEGVQVS